MTSNASTLTSTRLNLPKGLKMLRRFTYLDSEALSQYVTSLEDGLVTESTRRSMREGTGTGGVDAKFVHASGEKTRQDVESLSFVDTDEARFNRLLIAAEAEPEALAWVDVLDPKSDFDGIGIGGMMSWECDLFVPDIVQLLSKSGGAIDAIRMMQNLSPMARRLGLDMEGLPDDKEMSAAAGFLSGMDASLLVVGEDDDTDWRVAGHLKEESVRGELEGRARMVAKVAKVLPAGRWKPYVTFPGMNLVPRDERRRLERRPPEPGKEEEYLRGPALLVDVLAIYR